MKDYSINEEERKDFVLGYNITNDGMIKIKFAKGKPWLIPYNNENEQILLDKMNKQLDKSGDIEGKLKESKKIYFSLFLGFIATGWISLLLAWQGAGTFDNTGIIAASVSGCISLISLFVDLKINAILNDLIKNKKFIEIEEKLNKSVRTKQNTLVDVSNKTRNVIKDSPEDRPVFNINSFNYVPFRDIEQIMENVERNESFGFNYSQQEKSIKGIAKKKTR